MTTVGFSPKRYRTLPFRAAGGLVFLSALVFYALLMARYPFPSEWTAALGSLAGFDPFRPLSRPVWQMILSVFARLPGDLPVTVATWFSVVCGAVSAWLVYEVGIRMKMPPRVRRSAVPKPDPASIRILTGVIAAVFSATSIAVIFVSTRIHPLSFDLALLLGAVLLAILYRDDADRRVWFGFALLFGVGLSEFSSFVMFGPLFFFWWVWLFWRSKSFKVVDVSVGLLLILAGLSVSFWFTWSYWTSPVAEWREFDSYLMVVKTFWKDQIGQVLRGMPRHGWLIVFLTTVAPGLFLFIRGFETASDKYTNFGIYAIRLVLLGVGLVTLFNLPASPWRTLGLGSLVVLPYVLTALWMGLLIGYFSGHILTGLRDRKGHVVLTPLRRRMNVALILLAGLVLGWAGARNTMVAWPKGGTVLNDLAREMLADREGVEWILHQGSLGPILEWESRRRLPEARLISEVASQSPAYLRFLETYFDDPGVRSVVRAGLNPLLNEWLASDAGVTERLLVFGHPDTWILRGYLALPSRGGFTGIDFDEELPGKRVADPQAELTFLDRFRGRIGADVNPPLGLERIFRIVGDSLGMYANNLGFTLGVDGDVELAKTAFEYALSFQPRNLSAMLNLGAIYQRLGEEASDAALRAAWDAEMIRLVREPSPLEIAGQYGWVNDFRVYAVQGVLTARAGLRGIGLARLEQAYAMDRTNLEVLVTLVDVLIEQGDSARAKRMVDEAMGQAPEHDALLRRLARIHYIQGNTEAGDAILSRMENGRQLMLDYALERAAGLIDAGDYGRARAIHGQLRANPATRGQALMGLAEIARATGDSDLMEDAISGLLDMPAFLPGQLFLYDRAWSSGDLEQARVHLGHARRVQSGNPEVIQRQILLDVRTGERENARRMVRTLVNLDPGHHIGNYLLAELHAEDGRLDLAEASLRRALERMDFGDGLNALAWNLHLQGRNSEALPYTYRAIEIHPNHPFFLSTHGLVLLLNGKASEAVVPLTTAVEQAGHLYPIFRLHLAEALAGSGKMDQAREVIAETPRPDQGWNPYEDASLQRLRDAGVVTN
ncbi:MAG TPA: tetratricopeptide repeat protein [Kiritimatiellia bacterium]|nr:tetratricopeptide repeat protein [Kiritimatiellia bacterium]